MVCLCLPNRIISYRIHFAFAFWLIFILLYTITMWWLCLWLVISYNGPIELKFVARYKWQWSMLIDSHWIYCFSRRLYLAKIVHIVIKHATCFIRSKIYCFFCIRTKQNRTHTHEWMKFKAMDNIQAIFWPKVIHS